MEFGVGDIVTVRIDFGFGKIKMKVLAVCGDMVTVYHEPTGIIGCKHRAEIMQIKNKNLRGTEN